MKELNHPCNAEALKTFTRCCLSGNVCSCCMVQSNVREAFLEPAGAGWSSVFLFKVQLLKRSPGSEKLFAWLGCACFVFCCFLFRFFLTVMAFLGPLHYPEPTLCVWSLEASCTYIYFFGKSGGLGRVNISVIVSAALPHHWAQLQCQEFRVL